MKHKLKLGARSYPIPGFSDYFILKSGEIWNKKNTKFLKPWKLGKYLAVTLYKKKIPYKRLVHRLVLETFIGSCPKGMETCHNNGNPIDNRLENLRWGTKIHNSDDAFKHGTKIHGEKCHLSRLNSLQVRIIRRLLKSKILTHGEIGKIFGVGRTTITEIKANRCWKHI